MTYTENESTIWILFCDFNSFFIGRERLGVILKIFQNLYSFFQTPLHNYNETESVFFYSICSYFLYKEWYFIEFKRFISPQIQSASFQNPLSVLIFFFQKVFFFIHFWWFYNVYYCLFSKICVDFLSMCFTNFGLTVRILLSSYLRVCAL